MTACSSEPFVAFVILRGEIFLAFILPRVEDIAQAVAEQVKP